MAEPLEQRQGLTDGPGAGGLPPAPPPPEAAFPGPTVPGADQPYGTLSVLALVGFGVGAVYAAAVVLLALAGFLSGRPLLLSPWTIAVPLIAVILCLVARAQIRNSEGTRAGDSLARWGLQLSLVVCLCYWAYYAAVYFAVRQQAQSFGESWLERLKSGEIAKAARETLPPLARLSLREDDPELGREINARLGVDNRTDPPVNWYHSFTQRPLARMLARAGESARIIPRGMKSWEYTRGGYLVTLQYDLELPEGKAEASLTVHGSSATNDEYEGRQWFVVLEKTEVNPGLRDITPEGADAARLASDAEEYLKAWKTALLSGDRVEALAHALPDAEEARLRTTLSAGAAAGGAALAAMPGGEMLSRGYRHPDPTFVTLEPGVFLTEDTLRNELAEDMRRFLRGDVRQGALEFNAKSPLRVREGDRIVFRFDCRSGVRAKFFAEGFLDVEGDAAALRDSSRDPGWRVRGFRLVWGRKLTPPEGGRPR